MSPSIPPSPRLAVLLVHLGTPAEPTAKSIRKFLRRFLSDSRVVEVSRPIWLLILYLFVLPFRPAKLAPNYKRLWDQYGDSPLRLIAKKQHALLQQNLDISVGAGVIKIFTATSYSENSVAESLLAIKDQQIDKVVVLPLYPQFSATTTGAVYDQLADYIKLQRDLPELHIIKQYYQYPVYRRALACSVEEFWAQNGKAEILLCSFHGLPQSYVDKGDPYYGQCLETAENLAKDISLNEKQWAVCFQSQVGKAQWLKPYLSPLLRKLAGQGVKTVDVVCPSFSADCIETLEEIAEENRLIFEAGGGQRLRLIPSLNDREDHIDMMQKLLMPYLGDHPGK